MVWVSHHRWTSPETLWSRHGLLVLANHLIITVWRRAVIVCIHVTLIWEREGAEEKADNLEKNQQIILTIFHDSQMFSNFSQQYLSTGMSPNKRRINCITKQRTNTRGRYSLTIKTHIKRDSKKVHVEGTRYSFSQNYELTSVKVQLERLSINNLYWERKAKSPEHLTKDEK